MAGFNIEGKVQTVLGLVDPVELGVTFTHDHLLVSTDHMVDRPAEASARHLYHQPVTLESLAYRKYHFGRVAAVSGLEDVELAIDEANLFKQYGGGTIVEPSSMGIGRDPVGLARISRATGVKIVMGGSFYVDAAHPADMSQRDESELVEKIVQDIVEGVDGTGIRSGVIGEVGCTWPLTDNERKVLRASGRAQRITGAPLLIHPGRNEHAPLEIIEVLSEVGADLGRTIIGHLDRTVFEKSTLRRMAESGIYMEWDLFGKEESYYGANTGIDMPGDAKRMDDISWIASEGYEDKIVVAHDIDSKDRLTVYGGHGYFYILSHIVPRMRQRGFTDEAIRKILVDNPARVMAFAAPSPRQ